MLLERHGHLGPRRALIATDEGDEGPVLAADLADVSAIEVAVAPHQDLLEVRQEPLKHLVELAGDTVARPSVGRSISEPENLAGLNQGDGQRLESPLPLNEKSAPCFWTP